MQAFLIICRIYSAQRASIFGQWRRRGRKTVEIIALSPPKTRTCVPGMTKLVLKGTWLSHPSQMVRWEAQASRFNCVCLKGFIACAPNRASVSLCARVCVSCEVCLCACAPQTSSQTGWTSEPVPGLGQTATTSENSLTNERTTTSTSNRQLSSATVRCACCCLPRYATLVSMQEFGATCTLRIRHVVYHVK